MTSKAHIFEDKTRTKDVLIDKQLNFNALLLSEQTLSGLHKNGFRIPSPIQLKAIPIGKCGFDLILKSKSGTGKTAVFSIIALELVNINKNAVQVLILAPTREVAVQIQDVLMSIGSAFEDLAVEFFIGGLSIDDDLKKLAKCHIAVGAPGRIKHLIQLGALKLDKVKLFVLDEADKLIGSDMKIDIEYIWNRLPSAKQVVASSATYDDKVIAYLETNMSGSTLVEPSTSTPLLLGLKQFVSVVKSNLNVVHQLNIKNEELNKLLSQVTFSQCLVFTNYQCRAESISNTMNRNGWKSMYISSAQAQAERLKVINFLKEGQCRVLMSTDITARGIDAANIDLVINYDVPLDVSTYLHRMGRAGRFGSQGVCITIAAKGKELNDYRKILGEIGGVNMCVAQLPQEIPNDLWNADTSGFELIQGVVDSDKKPDGREQIINSIIDLKVQRGSTKKETSKSKEICEEPNDSPHTVKIEDLQLESQDADIDMSNTVEAVLESNRLKDSNLCCIGQENIDAVLEDLASGILKPEILEIGSPSFEQHVLGDVLSQISSKKRKRIPENITCEDTSGEANEAEGDNTKNDFNYIICKNIALLNATKLLSEVCDANEIPEEISPALNSHLAALNEDRSKETFKLHTKEDILNFTATGQVDDESLHEFENCRSEDSKAETSDRLAICPNAELEDIFKLSYDYALNSQTTHWLDILGEDLEEKMSLTEKSLDNPIQDSNNETSNLSNVAKRRKRKTNKKKIFKDFTQKSKTNKTDVDQAMEICQPTEEATDIENKVNSNVCYEAGLCSDTEYATNDHFTSCFNYYSDELTEKLQTFEDVDSFNAWFADWQWQVQGVRDYVQQNIYLQEMNKYAYYKHS